MIVLVYGMPGSGKSALLHALVRKQEATHRFFVLDHAEEWGMEADQWLGKPPSGITLIEPGDNLPDELPATGIFVFRGWEPLTVAGLTVSYGNTAYVDDEIDMTANRKGWEESPLREIVHRGRHAENADGDFTEVHLMGACRRPQSLHTDLTDIANEVYVFRVQGSRTLQRLKYDSIIEDLEWDTIRTLPRGRFWHFPSNQYLRLSGPKERNEKPQHADPQPLPESQDPP